MARKLRNAKQNIQPYEKITSSAPAFAECGGNGAK